MCVRFLLRVADHIPSRRQGGGALDATVLKQHYRMAGDVLGRCNIFVVVGAVARLVVDPLLFALCCWRGCLFTVWCVCVCVFAVNAAADGLVRDVLQVQVEKKKKAAESRRQRRLSYGGAEEQDECVLSFLAVAVAALSL